MALSDRDCVGCGGQANNNGDLSDDSREKNITPMVVGVIIGTIAAFAIVVFLLFYCRKLENARNRKKTAAEAAETDNVSVHDEAAYPDNETTKSEDTGHRSSLTVVGAGSGPAAASLKRSIFSWSSKKSVSTRNSAPAATSNFEMV